MATDQLQELLNEKRIIEARMMQDTLRLRELRAIIRGIKATVPKGGNRIQDIILSALQEKR